MSDLETILIIVLVIGVIASNLAVLKYSAKYKMPQFGKENKPKPSGKAASADKPGLTDTSDEKAKNDNRDSSPSDK